MAKKEVQKKGQSKNLNLLVFELLKQGFRPSQITGKLGISKTALQYYLKSLKADFKIRKVGYGTWEIISEEERNKFKSTGSSHYPKGQKIPRQVQIKPDKVRGHAFQFTIQLPEDFRNWDRRREHLTKLGITYTIVDNILGGAEKLTFRERNIILTNKSILVYEPASFLADTSQQAYDYALADFNEFTKALGRHLGINFERIVFKVSQQHYALIQNALARQYNKEGKRLTCYDEGKRWFVIDNSLQLNEAETINPKTAKDDNKIIQDFFNSLKTNPTTPAEILLLIKKVAQQEEEINKALAMLTLNLKIISQKIDKN